MDKVHFHRTPLLALFCLALACGDDSDNSLNVAWTFGSGDCSSNSIQTVRVTWTPEGGASQTSEFECTDGQGKLGEVEGGGTYAILAQGLDAEGVVRAENYGTSVSFGDSGTGGRPVDVVLQPKSSDVVVSWSGCPAGFILPYFITLYRPPAQTGGALIDKVTEAQQNCSNGETTLQNVKPGDYIVELDSRAVSPAIRSTAPVTVVAGETATVTLGL